MEKIGIVFVSKDKLQEFVNRHPDIEIKILDSLNQCIVEMSYSKILDLALSRINGISSFYRLNSTLVK